MGCWLRSGTQRFLRFDMLNRVMEPLTFLKFAQGTAVVGNKTAIMHFIDGDVCIPGLIHVRHTGPEVFRLDIMR